MANLRENQLANKMLVFSIIAFVVVGAIAAIMFITPFSTYTNFDYGIEIKFPDDWEMKERVEGSVVVFGSPLETSMDTFQENVNVSIQDLSGMPMTLEQYTDAAIGQLKEVFHNVTVVSSTPAKLAGRPAHQIVYVAADPKTANLKIMHVWFVEGDKAYTVTYTAMESKYDEYLGIANKMIRSFKVKP